MLRCGGCDDDTGAIGATAFSSLNAREPMSQMIERVATALRLESAQRRQPTLTASELVPLTELAPGIGEMYRRQAAAAIAALPELNELARSIVELADGGLL